MKKLTSIFLIFALLIPFWLMVSVLQYEKYITKKEIKKNILSGINKNELVLIKIAKAETNSKLRWEHSKEFEYMDEMYDVVETETKDDSVLYWCWWDHEETKLNKKLELLVKQAADSKPQNRKRSQRLQNLINSFYSTASFNYEQLNKKRIKKIFSRYNVVYVSQYVIPETPPPKVYFT